MIRSAESGKRLCQYIERTMGPKGFSTSLFLTYGEEKARDPDTAFASFMIRHVRDYRDGWHRVWVHADPSTGKFNFGVYDSDTDRVTGTTIPLDANFETNSELNSFLGQMYGVYSDSNVPSNIRPSKATDDFQEFRQRSKHKQQDRQLWHLHSNSCGCTPIAWNSVIHMTSCPHASGYTTLFRGGPRKLNR